MRRRLLTSGAANVKGCLEFDVLTPTSFKFTGTNSNTLQYSINGSKWKDLPNDTYTSTLNQGDKIYFKGTCTPSSSSPYGIGTFASNGGTWNVEGTPMSLLFGDDFSGQTSLSGKNYAFSFLFYQCTKLKSAENLSLPATTLAPNCYYRMFWNCTSLTTAPTLSATTLANYCYSYMFYYCTSLTTAPSLPATKLASGCYSGMFSNTNVLPDCTNIDFKSSTVVASGGLQGLFRGTKLTDSDLDTILKSHGINNYSLPCTTLATRCYSYMFADCTGLTTAPTLPATKLKSYCYENMFAYCSGLTTVQTTLPATTLANYCYYFMFVNCTGLTTAPTLPATTLAPQCYYSMFQGCTNLTTAPSLPATTLKSYCYKYMFDNCSKLNSITCLATDISATDCTKNWVSGVASTGTFTKAASMTSWTTGVNGIPTGWTRVNA